MQRTRQRTILLVEDEAIIAISEKIALEKCGYAVISVSSGNQAVEFIEMSPDIDLILMDVDLGTGMDGTRAAELILQNHDLPIVFLSSHTEPETVAGTQRITSYGYVAKASSITVLDTSIKIALRLFEANSRIRESEAQQTAMASNIADVIVIIDRDAINRYTSPNVEKWFGWKAEELVGTSAWERVHPDDLQATQRFISTLMADPGAGGTTEYRNRCSNGDYKWVEITVVNLFHDRAIRGLLGNYHDISRRKQAQDALLKSQSLLNEMGRIAKIGGWRVDLQTERSEWTRELYAIHEVDLSFVPTVKKVIEFDTPACREVHRQAIRRATQSGQPYDLELEVVTAKGNSRWLRVLGRPGYTNGVMTQRVGITQDITEQKLNETRLRQSEEKYRKMVANISDVISIMGADGVLNYNSPNIEKRFGWSAEELAGTSGWDTVHHDDLQRVQQEFLSLVENDNATATMEYRFKCRDGSYKLIELTAVNLCNDPLIDGVLMNFHDITERSKTEATIKALLAERELTLKEVHHRVKNNMNTVSSLLSLQASTLKDPEAIGALEDAERRVNSLLVLYDKLYRSSSYDDVSVQRYLSALVDEIIGNFVNSDSVRVEKRIQDFELDAARVQPLGIIVNELLSNSMKYAFGAGETGMIGVSATLSDGHVTVGIRDNGKGIPDSVGFENSTGLGLQLVAALAAQIGGTIRIERENGTAKILEFEL